MVTRNGVMDQVEQDFMFAVYLQKQEDSENESGNRTAARPARDPDVGHFCAPEMPGFCKANFCIFHTQ